MGLLCCLSRRMCLRRVKAHASYSAEAEHFNRSRSPYTPLSSRTSGSAATQEHISTVFSLLFRWRRRFGDMWKLMCRIEIMLSTKLCIMGAAALAVCKVVAAQTGPLVGESTIGTMEDTFTIPADEWDGASPAACTAVMAGCTGELSTLKEETGGSITVIDDCTFRISQYTFTGDGPAVEWCDLDAVGLGCAIRIMPAMFWLDAKITSKATRDKARV